MNAADITVVDQQFANQTCFVLNTLPQEEKLRLLNKLDQYGIDDPRTPELIGALADYWHAVLEAPLAEERAG